MDKPTDYGREVRDTVVKSGLTGVAATVLAVTFFSPAGFGGIIGTSLASGFGLDSTAAAADDPYAALPAFPSPLSADELNTIRSQLARTTASLEITRAATEARIEHIRSIALTERSSTLDGPSTRVVAPSSELRLSTSSSVAFAAPSTVTEAAIVPVSYSVEPVASDEPAAYRDPNLELADLLLADETR